MIDLEKMKNDLQELARSLDQGHLTRPEVVQMRLELAWALTAASAALKYNRHPEEPQLRRVT